MVSGALTGRRYPAAMTDTQTKTITLGEAMAQALEHAQSGNLRAARDLYGDILRSDPENPDALCNMGVVAMQMGDWEDGSLYLEKALKVRPGDGQVMSNLHVAYTHLSCQAQARDDKLDMIGWYRKLMSLGVHLEPTQVNLLGALSYADQPGLLSDFNTAVTPEALGKTILVACMPKSGSSWLVSAIHNLTGFPDARLSLAFIENEQELYPPAAAYWATASKVVHQHCRASSPNLKLIQAYGMHPIVLVRNLADTLVSMRDFWAQGAVRNSFHYGDWDNLDETMKHDTLIQHLGPWYIQFFVSWVLAEQKGEASPLWVRYEDMTPNKEDTLKSVADFCGLGASDADVAAAIAATDGDKVKTRFNKGVAGRGAETFSVEQHEMLRSLTRPFPSVDFSPIGL
jgi:tetratricopeptide (TPR) repeat protein